MHTYLLNLWDWVRTSYWFLPSIIATGAVALAFVVPWVDLQALNAEIEAPEWMRTTTGTARATLSALAGAMMSVTGTVFSITIVTLSMTSQQFGPRLLRRFMYDLPTQVTLGVFLATGLYCLLLLRIVENREDAEFALNLSVFVAVLLAVISMALLIYFIHHVAILIQAPQVVAAVSRDLDNAIVRLFPEKIGESERECEADTTDGSFADDKEPSLVITSKMEGYIQAIDADGLLNLASRDDLVIRLICRPGDFITIDSEIVKVYCRTSKNLNSDKFRDAVNKTIVVGMRRTPRQDLRCAMDELVEVAVRSLSPGINDPFTAMNCIDRLGAALGRLVERQMPNPHRIDSEGTLRIVARPFEFDEVLSFAFDPVRESNTNSSMVTHRILLALSSILSRATREEDVAAIRSCIQRTRVASGMSLEKFIH